MSKKNAITLILIIFVIVMGGLFLFYFSNNKNPIENIEINEEENIFSPFGTSSKEISKSPATSTDDYYNYVNNNETPKLRQIYPYPISGFIILKDKNGIKSRFVDRATGNIYEITPNSEEIKRITNTTVLKTLESIWSNTGESLIYRYSSKDPDKIDNYSAKIKISSSTDNSFNGEIVGKLVYQNADRIIINPSGNKSFGITRRKDFGGSYGVISSLDGTNNKQIFSSEISEWLISWPKDNIISFTTKPSYKQNGFLFFLDTNNNSFTKIFGRVLGMTTLVNKETTGLLYSNSSRGSVNLNYYDIKNNVDKNLQISTFSDKCVWSNKDIDIVYCAIPKNISNGNYPDSWYQGLTSFNDNLWKIDVNYGTTELIYQTDIVEGIEIDAIDLKLSLDDSFLMFVDKTTLTPWGLKI